MEPKDRIIVPLDVSTLSEAENLIKNLASYVGCFKVGLELLTAQGAPHVVRLVADRGGKVMFDGKFNDIPNTVGGAVEAAVNLGVSLFTLHAATGRESIRAAVKRKGNSLALGVTILTSIDNEECISLFGAPAAAKVHQFALLLAEEGCDGIVCSPEEVGTLAHDDRLKKLLKITPGVRPTWFPAGDQKRVATPAEAIGAGADYLVVGRPITKPPSSVGSPVEAAKRVADEIAEGLTQRRLP